MIDVVRMRAMARDLALGNAVYYADPAWTDWDGHGEEIVKRAFMECEAVGQEGGVYGHDLFPWLDDPDRHYCARMAHLQADVAAEIFASKALGAALMTGVASWATVGLEPGKRPGAALMCLDIMLKAQEAGGGFVVGGFQVEPLPLGGALMTCADLERAAPQPDRPDRWIRILGYMEDRHVR